MKKITLFIALFMATFLKRISMAEEIIGISEGDICNRDGCNGVMIYKTDGNCSCHINPPCLSCTNSILTCSKCYYEIY